MAKKPTKKSGKAKGKPKDTRPAKDCIIEAALKLAVDKGWQNVSLGDIAKASGLTLGALHEECADKSDVLALLGRRIDRQVLDAVGKADETLSPRDRLFDVLMERFDALNAYRPGLVAILGSFAADPKQAVISLPHLCRSMSWMLEAAGENTNGPAGAVKVAGLTGIYLKILKDWKNDDSEDLAKTMAALDQALGQAEKLMSLVCGFSGPGLK